MSTLVHDLDWPQIDVDRIGAGPDTRDVVADLAAKGWLIKTPFGYLLTRHEDCVAVLKDKRWYQASRLLAEMNQITDERYLKRQQRPSILSMEGDEHQRLRRLVAGAFTPRAADRLRPFMREVINGLIDPFAATGRCDFVTDVCEPYPIPIICELLGAPNEDWEQFSRWATAIFQIFNDDLADHVDEVVDAGEALDAYVLDLIDNRRDDPRDDLLGDLIAAEEAGDRLSNDELIMLVEAVILAGTDTTRNQLACALAVFTDHPDQWAELAERPELAARATEESLRYLGAIRGTGRFAAEDIEYRGVLFPAGTLVFPSFVGANHDADLFDDPARFDITADRGGVGHLTLGFGLHYCLGANLARAELQEALIICARRMPNLRLDGEIVWKPDGFGIWGPASLPLAFDPVEGGA
ncbi:MAG: cytochrome P450 [Acidimicrobiia bacterium]|nr:cytochrome P450 [Acidimicrobiia bacterium]